MGSSGLWTIDSTASVARFEMSYLVVATLKGRLGAIEGTLLIDEANHNRSAVVASIDARTLNTGVALRDKHLLSRDFFDVERFPTVTFQSGRVLETGPGRFRVAGRLTIRNTTREVTLDAAYEEHAYEHGDRRARFAATTSISRGAFGLGRSGPIETSGLIASDRVTVTLDILATAG